jgi:GT2 family glycosyltransferase
MEYDSGTPKQMGTASVELPKLSVIVLNYNGARFLHDCLSSVISQDYPNMEIILVDNASADNSCEIVEREFPSVKLLKLDRNYHFSGGMNRGVKASSGAIALLLNNDTVVMENCFRIVMNSMVESGADLCGCSILKHSGVRPLRSDQLHQTLDFAGAAFFVRKAVWEKLEGIDEDFHTYFELKDFSIRAVLKGYKVMVEPGGKIFHIGSATTKKMSGYALVNMSRNFPMLVLKDFRVLTAAVILSLYFSSRTVLILKLAFSGEAEQVRYRLKGSAEFIRMIPQTLEKRVAVQSSRICSDREIIFLRGKSIFKLGIDGGI